MFVKISNPVESSSKQPNGHVLILDASGSMSMFMNTMQTHVLRWLANLPNGDMVSIAWFSSEGGDYEWFIRNAELTVNRERLYQLIRTKLVARNMTCFSEVLTSLNTILSEMGRPNLAFFTDGYPIVKNTLKEERATFTAITNNRKELSSVLLIGYGDCNVNLLSRMAAEFGGQLVYANSLDNLSSKLTTFSDTSSARVLVPYMGHVGEDDIALANGKYVAYLQDDRAFLLENDVDHFYLFRYDSLGSSGVKVDDKRYLDIASVYLMQGKTEQALNVLLHTGDKYFIDRVMNAISPDELVTIANELVDNPVRYSDGFVSKGYLPDPNAFCVLDLLRILREGNAKLALDHFKGYKRITGPSYTYDTEITFTPNPQQFVPLSHITWNKERLNLSVLVPIIGYASFAFGSSSYRVTTSTFKTYTIIADGKLNVSMLPVVVDKATYDKLHNVGLIQSTLYSPDNIYMLHIDHLPLINRSMQNLNVDDLYDLVWRELLLETAQKGINSYIEKDDPRVAALPLPESVIEFCYEHGLTERGFSIKRKANPTTDIVQVPSFDFYVEKRKTVPDWKSIRNRYKDDKQNVTDVVHQATFSWNSYLYDDLSQEELSVLLHNVKEELSQVRERLASIKLAIALGKAWFNNLPITDRRYHKDGETLVLDFGVKNIKI